MAKPRTLTGNGLHFPYEFKSDGGRVGLIKKWSGGKFGTYFRHGEKKHRNSFANFQAAYEYLERVFDQLDKGIDPRMIMASSTSEDLRAYHELTQLLREAVPGATLRDAVDFFIENRLGERLQKKRVNECKAALMVSVGGLNLSPSYEETLERHLGHFEKQFGSRLIHEVLTGEIDVWLKGQGWSAKTQKNTRGSLLRLFLYARDKLNALRKGQPVAPEHVDDPQEDQKEAVEIYRPAQMKKLLVAASDEMLRVIVPQGFLGCRPDEVHAENADRSPLDWRAFNWHDALLHVEGQKVRSKATRDVPIQAAARSWLEPLKEKQGPLWTHKSSYNKKFVALCKKAGVPCIDNGLRHSYASYRIRELKGNLSSLAYEMGNSPDQIVGHYKKNVTDAESEAWFALTRALVRGAPKV